MLPYAVVADDLTGAGDAGVQFTLAGMRTRLSFGQEELSADLDVLVQNTDSRAVSGAEAYTRVKSAVEVLRTLGVRSLYKKIDSTLRGNLGAELDAVLDALPEAVAVLCPAFPANGRTVVGGHLLVDGEPVSRTPIAHDPATPVTESYIPDLVAAESRRTVGRLDLSAVVKGPECAAASLADLCGAGVEVVVADAVRESDLQTIVTAAASLSRPVVLVGAAGLAAPLADRWSQARRAGQPAARRPLPRARKVLAVVGSVHTASRAQLSELTRHGMPLVVLETRTAIAGGDAWACWLGSAAERLQSLLAADVPGVVLTTSGSSADVAEARRLVEECGMEAGEAPRLLAARLAELADAAVAKGAVDGLVLTGGDTAAAVLRRLAATGLDLASEVGPGIPAGCLAGGSAGGMPVITKAGGFGGSDALWQAVTFLRMGTPR